MQEFIDTHKDELEYKTAGTIRRLQDFAGRRGHENTFGHYYRPGTASDESINADDFTPEIRISAVVPG